MVTNELSKFDFVKYGSELSAIHPISSCSVEEWVNRTCLRYVGFEYQDKSLRMS